MAENLKTLVQASLINSGDLLLGLNDSQSILNIDQTSGKNLDLIGGFVQDERGSSNDFEYSNRLKLKQLLNASFCNRDDLFRAVEYLSGSSDIDIAEGSAIIYIQINNPMTPELIRQIKEYVAAGVGLLTLVTYTDSFAFEGGDPSTLGFGDYNDVNVGGKFSHFVLQ